MPYAYALVRTSLQRQSRNITYELVRAFTRSHDKFDGVAVGVRRTGPFLVQSALLEWFMADVR